MNITPLPALTHKGVDYARTFVDFGSKNDLNHNLTELRPASDAYAGNSDEADTSHEFGYSNHADWFRFLRMYAFVGKVLTKEKPTAWLDAGCGELQLPFYLNKNRFKPEPGTRYFGIELRATEKWLTGENAAGNTKYRYKADTTLIKGDLVVDDFSKVPNWPADGFQVVVSTEVFEHLPRSYGKVFMQRLFDWTLSGGVCIFSTPNAGVSASTAENHTDPETGESREWTYADKLALMQEVGFVVEKSYGCFTGATYLPPELQEYYKKDPYWSTAKEYLSGADYVGLISINHPEYSVASLQVLRKP